MRGLFILLVAFIVLAAGGLFWLRSHEADLPAPSPTPSAAPVIEKQAPVVSTRRFNPAAPPADMPPLHPGEAAVTDSNFGSTVRISSQTRTTGGSTGVVKISAVKMSLQLSVTIWVPEDVTQKVLEHEEGHRQISEFFYQDADKLAAQVASSYIGREFTITGDDLDAEANKLLQKLSSGINAEYTSQLKADSAQQHYDAITDHARNDVTMKEAVAGVLK